MSSGVIYPEPTEDEVKLSNVALIKQFYGACSDLTEMATELVNRGILPTVNISYHSLADKLMVEYTLSQQIKYNEEPSE